MTKALLRAFGRDAGKKHFLATWHMGRMSIGKVALKPETARRAELPAPAATARGKAAATVGTGKPHAQDPRGCTEPAMLGGGGWFQMEGAGAEPRGLDSVPALPQAAAGSGDKVTLPWWHLQGGGRIAWPQARGCSGG